MEVGPIKASRGDPAISQLFFAADLLLFKEISLAQVEIAKDCLADFCRVKRTTFQNPRFSSLLILIRMLQRH